MAKTLQMYFAVSSPPLLLLPTAFVTSFSLVFARYFYTFCFSFSFLRCVFVGICCAMWHVQLLPCPMSSSLFPVACRLPLHPPLSPLLSLCCNCPTSVHSKLLCLPPHWIFVQRVCGAVCSALSECVCVCVCVTVSNLNCLLWLTHSRTHTHAILARNGENFHRKSSKKFFIKFVQPFVAAVALHLLSGGSDT